MEPFTSFLASLPPPLTLAAGVALLLAGGHALVGGAIAIARRFGVSTLLIGLTIVAFGTSAPELAFNIVAATGGNAELSFGNVVGSNIANLGLVLGIAALVSPLAVHGRVVKREMPLLLGACLLTLLLARIPGSAEPGGPAVEGFTALDGAVLLSGFGLCLWLWFRLGRKDRADPLAREAEQVAGDGRGSPWLAGLLFLAGLLALLLGGKLTETGAVGIAAWLGFSKSLIGLTVVALATSLPEVVTSVLASRRGHTDLAVGNVVGSNLFNLLLVLGTTSAIAPVPLPAEVSVLGLASGWWDLLAMTGLTLLLWPFAATHRHRILKWEGFLLLAAYAGWLAWSILRETGI